jgi:hypothetical protein
MNLIFELSIHKSRKITNVIEIVMYFRLDDNFAYFDAFFGKDKKNI